MEKIKYIKLVFLTFSLIFFAGCAESQQVLTPTMKNENLKNTNKVSIKNEVVSTLKKKLEINTQEMKIINEDGLLFIFDGKKEYVLSSRGLDYNAHLSSDKKVLVVDILKTNNLQTIELFSKKESSRFKRVKRRLKRDIWNTYLKGKTYEFKDIDKPQFVFHEWVDSDTFELTLSYEFEDKFFEEIVRYDVY